MDFIFKTKTDWCDYVKRAFTHLCKGIYMILRAILIGILSVIVAVGNAIKNFVFRNPLFTLAVVCVLFPMILLVTYAKMTVKVKNAEAQRDSIGYELIKFKEKTGISDDDAKALKKYWYGEH